MATTGQRGAPADVMNPSDTTMWRIERDPVLRSTIVGMAVLEHAPDWAALRGRMVELADLIPRLRQRVAEPVLGVGAPRWVDDPGFDIDFHLRRMVLPGDADAAALLSVTAPMQMAAFDRARPLWEFTLVEGLHGGQAALVQKIHHSFTDGVGAVRLSRLLFDELDGTRAEALLRSVAAAEAAQPGAHHDGVRLVLDTVEHQAREAAEAAVHLAAAAPGALTHAALHPRRMLEQAVTTATSIARFVRPISEPLSPVMRDRGIGRRLAGLDFPLEALRAAGHAEDGTLNDAFLAALAGGMRRYHARHGSDVDRLRVTMPINQRAAGDAEGSNHFTPVRFELAVGVADPRERLRVLGRAAKAQRREPALRFTSQIASTLNALPAPLTTLTMASMLKAVDMVATNVPGLTTPVALLGAPVHRQYAFAPPSGAAFSAGLLSYLDTCTLGLVIDTAAVPDPGVMAECMAEGFAEVLAIATAPPARRRRTARTETGAP